MRRFPHIAVLFAVITTGTARADVIAVDLGPWSFAGIEPLPSIGGYQMTPFGSFEANGVTEIPGPFGGQLGLPELVNYWKTPNEPTPYIMSSLFPRLAPDSFTFTLPARTGAFVFAFTYGFVEQPYEYGPVTVFADGRPLLTTFNTRRVGIYAPPGGFIGSVTVEVHGSGSYLYTFAELAAAPASAPEPGTLGLLGLGAACLAGCRLRRRRS
jgi:hypothetical protein